MCPRTSPVVLLRWVVTISVVISLHCSVVWCCMVFIDVVTVWIMPLASLKFATWIDRCWRHCQQLATKLVLVLYCAANKSVWCTCCWRDVIIVARSWWILCVLSWYFCVMLKWLSLLHSIFNIGIHIGVMRFINVLLTYLLTYTHCSFIFCFSLKLSGMFDKAAGLSCYSCLWQWLRGPTLEARALCCMSIPRTTWHYR